MINDTIHWVTWQFKFLKKYLRDHTSTKKYVWKNLKNRYVGLINIYKPFFLICKILNINLYNKITKNKYILKFVLVISQKMFKILQIRKNGCKKDNIPFFSILITLLLQLLPFNFFWRILVAWIEFSKIETSLVLTIN